MRSDERREISLDELKSVKLVIWDLDDTFWTGTLSEGEVSIPQRNIDLVKNLTNRGIMQSICSKNDRGDVCERLKEAGLDDIFVFASIDWNPKGARVKDIVKSMQLSEKNALFIDDNRGNLEEARYYCPDMLCLEPWVIDDLARNSGVLGKDDSNLSRLRQYQILEKKHQEAEGFGSNREFLEQSDIRLSIHYDCEALADRLFELTLRTNQLNFTKVRPTRDEFDALLKNDAISKGYVSVTDRYGDYGIVGFFAISRGHAVHFLFSCRVLNMGVEQYVYALIGYPELEVVAPVSGAVSRDEAKPNWINADKSEARDETVTQTADDEVRIMIKGPCDLERSSHFLQGKKLDKELTHTDDIGRFYNYQSHIANIRSALFYDPKYIESGIKGIPFESMEWFTTDLRKKTYDMIFLSVLSESNHSVYRRDSDGFMLALGSRVEPLSNPKFDELYVNSGRQSQKFDITVSQLEYFRANYSRVDDYVEKYLRSDILDIAGKLRGSPRICFILSNEHEYLGLDENQAYLKKINDVIRELCAEDSRFSCIDVNAKLVKSSADTTDSVTHYTSRVYYELAQEVLNEIGKLFKSDVKRCGKLEFMFLTFTRKAAHNLRKFKHRAGECLAALRGKRTI